LFELDHGYVPFTWTWLYHDTRADIFAALGIIGVAFAVVMMIVMLTTYEDPINDLVEKYGKKYGLLK
jgi:hypothetical protein